MIVAVIILIIHGRRENLCPSMPRWWGNSRREPRGPESLPKSETVEAYSSSWGPRESLGNWGCHGSRKASLWLVRRGRYIITSSRAARKGNWGSGLTRGLERVGENPGNMSLSPGQCWEVCLPLIVSLACRRHTLIGSLLCQPLCSVLSERH